jgi:hypothetical protein
MRRDRQCAAGAAGDIVWACVLTIPATAFVAAVAYDLGGSLF